MTDHDDNNNEVRCCFFLSRKFYFCNCEMNIDYWNWFRSQTCFDPSIGTNSS